jgi:NDP-sugar pyrophosphorylase family protein
MKPRRTYPLRGFLLCAGRGTRFYPHTRVLPKVLLPFLNLPLSAYNLYLLRSLGVKEWAANIHVHPEILKDKLKEQAETAGLSPPVFSQEQILLGSAGGLLKLRSFFEKEEPFFYLNGDSFIWPQSEDNLNYFYKSHVESKALASFFVRPTSKTVGVIWADDKQQIASFLKKPEESGMKPYDFSGLALFSPRILELIKPGDLHIFKDVLESEVLKSHLRVFSVSGLKLLDMNQVDTYLEATKEALCFLQQREKGFLQQVLNCFSSRWNYFRGENYFSATKVGSPPAGKENILFCGREVKGLEKFSIKVKDFSVLGDHSSVLSDVSIESSVLGAGVSLDRNLRKELVLKV